MFSAQNKRKTLSWKPSQNFLWLGSVFCWPTFLMTNKHMKVWKVVFHFPGNKGSLPVCVPWLLLLLKQTIENKRLVMHKTPFTVHGPHCYLHLKRRVTQSSSLLLFFFFVESESLSTVHVNSWVTLHCSCRTGSGSKLNALNRVWPSKIKKLN